MRIKMQNQSWRPRSGVRVFLSPGERVAGANRVFIRIRQDDGYLNRKDLGGIYTMNQIPMTLFGAENCAKELEYLKSVRRRKSLRISLTPVSTAI